MDDLFKVRLAAHVFTWPTRPGSRWRPPRCAACRLPIRQSAEVIDLPRLGYCHPFCAMEYLGDNGE